MINIMKDTIEQLIKLADEKKLSVVVGAGFSKNASPKYLSWKELLKDMILEMFGFMARNTAEYAKIRGSNNEQRFWNCFVDQIIAEKGCVFERSLVCLSSKGKKSFD